MNRGYVKLWRKSLDAGWLENPELWTFWTWCLLKASHKIVMIKIDFQEITLEPGQFIFGRKKASEKLKMSEWKIRSCIDFLKKAGNLTIKTTNKFSIITIINWSIYQGESEENHQQNRQQPTSNPPQTRMKKNVKKNPDEISYEIFALTSKLFSSTGGKELFTRTIEAISTTRKSNQVSPSVVLKLLLKFQEYPEGQILAGMRTYLEKERYKEGKKEPYLIGIIKNQKPASPLTLEPKSTGSSLLDAYYRKQDTQKKTTFGANS